MVIAPKPKELERITVILFNEFDQTLLRTLMKNHFVFIYEIIFFAVLKVPKVSLYHRK